MTSPFKNQGPSYDISFKSQGPSYDISFKSQGPSYDISFKSKVSFMNPPLHEPWFLTSTLTKN